MSVPFVEDAFFFSLYNFSFFVKNQVFIVVWINIWVFKLIPLVNLYDFMASSSCFHYCSSVIELDVKDGEIPLLYQIVFIFPYEVDYYSFKVYEELCWDFDGDGIESIESFW